MSDELKPLTMLSRGGPARGQPPGDDINHIFVLNAVDRVGRVLFEDWADSDARRQQVWSRLREDLRSGVLRAATHTSTGMFLPVQEERWFGEPDEVNRRFRTGKMSTFGLGNAEWWFVERAGFDAMMFRLASSNRRSNEFAFEMDEWRWRLYDACIWVATEGQDTTTREIDVGILEEHGARQLFARLDRLGSAGPKLTGLSFGDTRIPVPYTIWERAHTGWLGHSTGHRVDFVPDGEAENQVRADLTLNRHTTPMYRDIRIERDALFDLFPQTQAQPTVATGKRNGGPISKEERRAEADCAAWLVANYMSRPNVAPIAKAALRALAFKQKPWGELLRGDRALIGHGKPQRANTLIGE